MKKRILCALCACVSIFAIAFSTIMIGRAHAEAGPPGGVEGGNCGDYWDTCFGATWQYYATTEDTIVIPGNSHVQGGTIQGCGKYGGYYRLGLATHRNGVRQAVTSGGKSITQFGFVQVYTIYNNGGSRVGAESPHPNLIAFREYDSLGGVAWDKAHELFEVAKSNDATNGYEWRQISWFCYDKKWDSPATGFQSKSKVNASTGSSESPFWDQNAADLEVQTDSSGTATVIFSHRLKYNADGIPAGTYNNASTSYTITIDDGSGGPWMDTWETPGASTAESHELPENATISTTVTLGDDEDNKRICSKITYTTKNLTWNDQNPHSMVAVNDTGQTEACAVIKKAEIITQNAGGVLFWPQSSVESVAEKDVVNHKEWTTDDKNKADGDKVSIQLSTDYNTAKANFEHKMHFEVDLGSYTFGANDTWDTTDMCTEYEVTYADGSKSGKIKYCPTAPATGSSTSSGETSIPGKQGHVINVPGTAIETIEYASKNIPIKREEVKYWGTCGSSPNTYGCWKSYNPKRYKYYGEGGSGSGNSSAEIEYVSPNEPDDSNGPSNGAGANGEPMYAGETTSMTWWAKAKAIETRRIMEFQSTVFEVQWQVNYSTDAVSGDNSKNLKYSDNPGRSHFDSCGYWRNHLTLRANNVDCARVEPGNENLNKTYPANVGFVGEHTVTANRPLVVPDYVGDKYCNSFGYKWQYFWGVKRISTGDQWEWKADNQTYWTHYDAACRVIAKKPSVAIWNGGIFSPGGITTSLASRYNNTAIATIASGLPNASFGSWTEHLAVANGPILNTNMKGFGSGASLAFGSNQIGVSPLLNSPLTIRNDIVLGAAGITPNPTLATRLASYLGDLPGTTDVQTGTTVNISSPIVTSGSYDDVYQMPQKIIYAPNATAINIGRYATEIDAWIIAPNAVINTCVDFQPSNNAPGGTETLPNSSNNPCDQELRINGPVIAKGLKLNRTGGADNIYGGWYKYTPGEIFNLSTDTYLWAYAQAGRYGSSYTEAYSRELPPRY